MTWGQRPPLRSIPECRRRTCSLLLPRLPLGTLVDTSATITRTQLRKPQYHTRPVCLQISQLSLGRLVETQQGSRGLHLCHSGLPPPPRPSPWHGAPAAPWRHPCLRLHGDAREREVRWTVSLLWVALPRSRSCACPPLDDAETQGRGRRGDRQSLAL